MQNFNQDEQSAATRALMVIMPSEGMQSIKITS